MKQNWITTALKRILTFDEPDAQYELLETEHGAPQPRECLNDVEPKNADGDAEVNASLAVNQKRLYREYRVDINPDIILRSFSLGGTRKALAAFINGMADSDQINDFILRPGMKSGCIDNAEENLSLYAAEHIFSMSEAVLDARWKEIKRAISEGRTAVLIDGETQAVLMDTRGFVSRSVGEPKNETTVMGPREAFTEHLRNNVTLLRRIIKTDDFVCEFRASGGRNNTRVAIAYRDGIANPGLVNEVKMGIAAIDTTLLLSTGTLEQLTERRTYSPMSQTLSTERPDRAAAYIMQGHVAVIVEGSPIVSLMPMTMFSLMTSAEDAYLRQPIGIVVRVVRYIGAFLSIVVPGYFVALALHHQGMLSGEVLATVVASRNMVFLPLPVEMIFLLLVFQLVREAGLSVPNVLGQSVGIIGGLLLGQAAVTANIVSTVGLIIVALTGLGNYTIRDYSTQLAAVYFRFVLVIAAWLGGLLALSGSVLLITAWLATQKSYGVPFLAPYSPKTHAKAPVVLRGKVRNHKHAPDLVNAGENVL